MYNDGWVLVPKAYFKSFRTFFNFQETQHINIMLKLIATLFGKYNRPQLLVKKKNSINQKEVIRL